MTGRLPTAARRLDQFYTRPDVAAACLGVLMAHIDPALDWTWVEPSAGDGAFFDLLPRPRVGIDIASARADVDRADFLMWRPPPSGRHFAVIGNPPFGKNASLARAFVNHAAGFADLIAFILPRTFEKPAFINSIDRRLHLVHQGPIDAESFTFDGKAYAVPTVFQIWRREQALRELTVQSTTHPHFEFVERDAAHFAFQRVGARAGLVSVEGLRKSPQSHYFIRARHDHRALLQQLSSIDWIPVKSRTAGNPSIGKRELIAAYAERFG